ncbi:MAG: DNA methyltransferase [Methanotrichaceae archaeon]
MIMHRMVRSPKIDRSPNKRSPNLYHYYAGFSPKFVIDMIANLNIDDKAVIMDPWNGSGTTTQVARDMGFSAIGYDINPVMVIVAKAKLLNCTIEIRKKLLDNLDSIIKIAASFQNGTFSNEDPLNAWLDPESALCFRNLEKAVHLSLVNNEYYSIYAQDSLANVSSLASFFYLALFKTLRSFLIRYVSSNPTWIKLASAKEGCIHPSPNEIYQGLENQIHEMIIAIAFNDENNNIKNLSII